MPSRRFCRYDLRTTDPDAARAFYTEVVGLALGGPLGVWLLHEQARARGAPAHWLGSIGVPDLEAARTRFLALGAEPLGTITDAGDGTRFAVLRDPAGAVVALRSPPETPDRIAVAWHHLHVRDPDRAWSAYSELFGWKSTETVHVPGPAGEQRLFAWEDGHESVGGIAATARLPGVHAHWLYCFRVTDLDAVLDGVRAHGGVVAAGPIALPSGVRLAACDDPQGAAFGLCAFPNG